MEDDEEDAGGHVCDGGEAAAEQWSRVKDGRTTELGQTSVMSTLKMSSSWKTSFSL